MPKPNPRIEGDSIMAKSSQALEDALRYTLTDTNLPSQFPDFQALTRELIRRLSPYAVLVDRETYNQLTKPQSKASKELEETTARYKAHNDSVEASMRERGSIPPGTQR
jgi:hypothetical protein